MNLTYLCFCMIYSESALLEIENDSRFVNVLQGNWGMVLMIVSVLLDKQTLYVLYITR